MVVNSIMDENCDILKSDLWSDIVSDQRKPKLIACRTEFFEMTKNLHAAILLEKIFYWYQPPKARKSNPKHSRLTIYREGYMWLGKRRDEWADIGFTPWQFDTAIKKLKELDYVVVKNSKYKRKRQALIRLTDRFLNDYYLKKYPNKEYELNEKRMLEKSKLQKPDNRQSQILHQFRLEISNHLKTSSLEEDIFVRDTYLFDSKMPSNQYVRQIRDTVERLYNLFRENKKPINDLKEEYNFFDSYKIFTIQQDRKSDYSSLSELDQFNRVIGVEPTSQTRDRLKSIWRHYNCSEMKSEGNSLNCIVGIAFEVRDDGFWSRQGLHPENADAALLAVVMYYDAYRDDFKWPNVNEKHGKNSNLTMTNAEETA